MKAQKEDASAQAQTADTETAQKLRIALNRIAELEQQNKKIVVITKNASSILHLSLEKDLTTAIKLNAEKLKEYIISISDEEHATKNLKIAEVIRVTAEFKSFCRNAIIEKIKSL